MRSGYILIDNGSSGYAGSHSGYWSLSASSKHYSGSNIPSAYRLGFHASGAGAPGSQDYRWTGFSLRWLKFRVGVSFFTCA